MGEIPIMSLAEAIKVTTVPNEPAILSDIRKFFGLRPHVRGTGRRRTVRSRRAARFLRRAAKVHRFEVPCGNEGRRCYHEGGRNGGRDRQAATCPFCWINA